MDQQTNFRIVAEPLWHTIGETRVSVNVARENDSDQWNVTAVLSRPATAPMPTSAAVDVELRDRQGRALAMTDRPSIPPVELGEELRIVDELYFKFSGSTTPAELLLSYRGKTVRFQLTEGRRDQT